jgi:hypothetical protein
MTTTKLGVNGFILNFAGCGSVTIVEIRRRSRIIIQFVHIYFGRCIGLGRVPEARQVLVFGDPSSHLGLEMSRIPHIL